MGKCSKCGNELREGAIFCRGCGTKVDAVPAAPLPCPVVDEDGYAIAGSYTEGASSAAPKDNEAEYVLAGFPAEAPTPVSSPFSPAPPMRAAVPPPPPKSSKVAPARRAVAAIPKAPSSTAIEPPPVVQQAGPPVPKTDAQENRILGVLAYLGILVAVPIFGGKKSKFARYHAVQGLNLLLVEIALWIVSILRNSLMKSLSYGASISGSAAFFQVNNTVNSIINIIGFVLGLFVLAFVVLGIVRAVQGKEEPLPLFGKQNILQFEEDGSPNFKTTWVALLDLLKKIPKKVFIAAGSVAGVIVVSSIALGIVNSARIAALQKKQAEEFAAAYAEVTSTAATITEPPVPVLPKAFDDATTMLAFTPADATLLGSSTISEGYIGMVSGTDNGFVFSYTSTQQGTAQMQAAVRPYEGRPYSIYVNDVLFKEVSVSADESFSIVPGIPVNFGKNTIKIVGTATQYWAPDFSTVTLTLLPAQEATLPAEGESTEDEQTTEESEAITTGEGDTEQNTATTEASVVPQTTM